MHKSRYKGIELAIVAPWWVSRRLTAAETVQVAGGRLDANEGHRRILDDIQA